jgi:hypothetical protein
MKNLLNNSARRSLLILVSLSAFAFAFAPLDSDAFDDGLVKRVKVKDNKVKVKTIDGKAKIKNKANGTQKIKVKGPNGDIAADIARFRLSNADCEELGGPEAFFK